jgi:hypothetical protein
LARYGPYLAALHRAGSEAWDVWPASLREPLPTIAVPLVDALPDVPLDLQAAFATVYDRFGYDLVVDYGVDPPLPELPADDLAWARQRIAAWMDARSSRDSSDGQGQIT